MLPYIKEKIDGLTMIAANYVKTPSKKIYDKQKMTDIIKVGKNLPFDFDYLLVSISKNGGLIAICKKEPNYLDHNKTGIDANILVMHQDAGQRYYIPIDWDYQKSYFVSLEFNDKEQLYGFCNDGAIRKMDILTKQANQMVVSPIFLEEGIVKAKTFDKGFIALTKIGNIYMVPEIKNQKPIFIVNIQEQLQFSNDVDFFGIYQKYSRSKRFELVLINEKGNGILNIEMQDTEDTYKKGKKVPISILEKSELEKYNPEKNESNSVIGKISAMCISPSKRKIALYCAKNSTVFILPTDFSKANKMQTLTYKLEDISDISENEKNEHKALFSFNNKYQFLFCGEDTVALCGQRFIVLLNESNEILSFKAIEGNAIAAMTGGILFKCISEVDGIRYFSKDGVYLISQVDPDLDKTCDPFQKNSIKTLIRAYGLYLSKNADCDKKIRDISQDLPNAINSLQNAAVNIFFTEKDNELRDSQMLLMKASQYGKSFVQKDVFNYDKYNERCKDIRIVNTLRNLKDTPRFITYKEYVEGLDPNSSEFMKKILRHHNYYLAFELSNYLGFENEKIYQRFCVANIKKLDNDINAEELFNLLNKKLKECQNVSYITIAKKCIKHNKFRLAEKFLEQEKSIVVKVPQYLQLKNWKKALDLAIESNDRTVIKVVIDKIFKVEKTAKFIEIVQQNKKAHKAVIEYLRMHDQEVPLKQYLRKSGDFEELLYMTLENFFKCKKIGDRKSYLGESKEYLKDLKGNPNADFYKNYLKDLEHSLKFKKDCIEKAHIIASNDISPFDNSIFECYKLGVETKYDFIETENKNFNIGQKKISYIRFKNLAEKKKFKDIEEILKKTNFKKLDISPLLVAKIVFNNQGFDTATEICVNYVTDPNEFEGKINLLKSMKKHKEALDVIVNDKKAPNKQAVIEGILQEKPDLRSYWDKIQRGK